MKIESNQQLHFVKFAASCKLPKGTRKEPGVLSQLIGFRDALSPMSRCLGLRNLGREGRARKTSCKLPKGTRSPESTKRIQRCSESDESVLRTTEPTTERQMCHDWSTTTTGSVYVYTGLRKTKRAKSGNGKPGGAACANGQISKLKRSQNLWARPRPQNKFLGSQQTGA
jgi:hypothetical protein